MSPARDDIAEPTISTYHAFAMDLLSQWALLIGGEPLRFLLTPTGSWWSTPIARSPAAM